MMFRRAPKVERLQAHRGRCAKASNNAKLRPGVDGVYLEFGHSHATFLPQVWESYPDPLDFLTALRRKADLPARFWHPDLRLTRYTVEKYADERPHP